MHIILGANGHVGSALAQTLLAESEPVTVVLHDAHKEQEWRAKGAQVAVADVNDAEALERVFAGGNRLFLLNPPAAPATDTASEERKTLNSILSAVGGAKLEKVVAISAYGAQPGEHIADLGVLYEMEQALEQHAVPSTILRAAYYMSNWDMALDAATQNGEVATSFPPDFKLPMVAPSDIGGFAARFMTEPVENTGLRFVEGPQWCSSADVAEAFAAALQKPVKVATIPREKWEEALQSQGFSPKAAQSFAGMTDLTLNSKELSPEASFGIEPLRGSTTLQKYVQELVQQNLP